jgi:hypothetical protein
MVSEMTIINSFSRLVTSGLHCVYSDDMKLLSLRKIPANERDGLTLKSMRTRAFPYKSHYALCTEQWHQQKLQLYVKNDVSETSISSRRYVVFCNIVIRSAGTSESPLITFAIRRTFLSSAHHIKLIRVCLSFPISQMMIFWSPNHSILWGYPLTSTLMIHRFWYLPYSINIDHVRFHDRQISIIFFLAQECRWFIVQIGPFSITPDEVYRFTHYFLAWNSSYIRW